MQTITDMFALYKTTGTVGIEVEMEGKGLYSIYAPSWRKVSDGSLRGDDDLGINAFEYVLKLPCSASRVPEKLEEIARYLAEPDGPCLVLSNRCGVHVHINCQKMNQEQVIKYIILYLILENVLLHYCGEDREGNMFCLRTKDAGYLLHSLINGQSLRKISSQDIRYSSINMCSLRKFGSLEFRALPTPSNLKDISKWVNILLAIRLASSKYENLSDMVTDVSSIGPIGFGKKVLPRHTELFKYEGAEQDLMEGAQSIQMVAYANLYNL